MSKELGRVEKPRVEDYAQGRRLFFVPLIYSGVEPKTEYLEKFETYWQEIEGQINGLEIQLGAPKKIYHELITVSGNEGLKIIKEQSGISNQIYTIRTGDMGLFFTKQFSKEREI